MLALALPAILVAAAGFYSSYRAERDATDLRLQEITRALSLSIDREVDKAETALRIFSLSAHLRSGDFAAFHRQVREASLAIPAWVALFELDGRAILNTRMDFGSSLQNSLRTDVFARIRDTRRPELSNLYTASMLGQPLVTLDVPVMIDGQVAYILSGAINQAAFQQTISDQRIRDGWNAAVLDGEGRIVARSRSPERFVGQYASGIVRDAIATSSEGRVTSVTLDGIPVRTYFNRSPTYGWTFVVSMPAAELTASLQRSLLWLMVLAGVLLVVIALAALLSQYIAKPIQQLVRAAQALGRGERVTGTTTQVREFDTIQTALDEASSAIRGQEAAREEVLERMAESEARLRIALNAGHLGSWEYTPGTGEFVASATCRANFGRGPADPFTYDALLESIHPEDRVPQAEAVAKAVMTQGDLHVEYRVIWPDHSEHWVRVSGKARAGAGGQLSLVGVSQDITERRLAEDRQGLLLHELNHRVKNTLATVQSVALMTRRSAAQGDPNAWDAFIGRLHGLSKTHDLLTATHWQGALLEDVLKNELDPYQDGLRRRIRLRGPQVHLQPGAVLALGLAVHELATNATKYGSLSVDNGQVSVMWALTTRSPTPALLVEWVESGGPPVKPPERQGFGTKLIQRGLAQQLGGEIKLDFKPGGVRCVISFPVKAVVLNLDEADKGQERAAS